MFLFAENTSCVDFNQASFVAVHVFVGARLHVTGGVLRGGRSLEGEASIAVLDTAAGVWLDRNGIVSSSRSNKGHDYDPPLELMRRCCHAAAAAAAVGVHIFIYGGLRGDILLDDFLVAENSPLQPDINSPERASPVTSSKQNQSNLNYNVTAPNLDGGPDTPSFGGSGMDKNSLEKLREASAAEAEAAGAVWQAVQSISSNPAEETSLSDENSQAAETVSDGSDTEGDVRLLPRAVVVAKEAVGNQGGMVRQLSLDQFENESRRMIPVNNDLPYPTKKFTRKKSPQGLATGKLLQTGGSSWILMKSDPTENDSVEGLRPNARGPGLVTFGPDRVTEFCKKNKLQLIIRAHECVMDGFERFALGQLITLFSATNYCGTANNVGAILVVGRGLVVVPKLIHPIPPPLQSPETSPERGMDETWMQELNIQRPPTPTRGRPQPDLDRGSLAYI
ncbi:hypothetical protein JHK85_017205 [Glycine max]|nr:hypothetical protein JHK85_017205 [Glycine max]KAG5047422.1 hypothetical protein JHK86_016828 [Glycine max]